MAACSCARRRVHPRPERGSRVKPAYCLGDPAFWAGALCIAGIAGNASRGGYGGRGQPGEGEYMRGLTGEAMADGELHILAVTLDGSGGVYKAYVDGSAQGPYGWQRVVATEYCVSGAPPPPPHETKNTTNTVLISEAVNTLRVTCDAIFSIPTCLTDFFSLPAAARSS